MQGSMSANFHRRAAPKMKSGAAGFGPSGGAADHAQQGSVGALFLYFNQPRRRKYHIGSKALAIMTPMAQA